MIYLDNAASSLMLDEVKQALVEFYQKDQIGANPNSLHGLGREAFSLLEMARKELAGYLGAARPSELIFTSGGTESDNLALFGITQGLRRAGSKRNLCLFSSLEHEAVASCVDELRAQGFECIMLPVSSNGCLDLERASQLISQHKDRLALASVMLCHNEFGVIQPIKDLARLVHAAGAYLHSDAVQAFGAIPCKVQELELDACSITSHKLGGPIGIGALYLKARTPFYPRLFGGGQEQGRRSGTQMPEYASAFSLAARLKLKDIQASMNSLAQKRDFFAKELKQKLNVRLSEASLRLPYHLEPLRELIPSNVPRHPGILALAVYKLEAEGIILQADARGLCIASGSACSSGSLELSRSLKAINFDPDYAYGVLRLSFDERISYEDLSQAADILTHVIVDLMMKEGIALE